MNTTLIIPCYNEARRLRTADIIQFLDQNKDFRCLMVNDGSQDDTATLLASMHEQKPDQCQWIDLPKNVGKAEAVRQGVLRALASGTTYIGYWDADLATPLESAVEFRRALIRHPHLQMIIGSRLRLSGHAIRRSSRRALLGAVFAKIANATLGMSFHDTQCGAKLFRNSELTACVFQADFQGKWTFDLEVLLRLRQATEKRVKLHEIIKEFVVEAWRDVPGSKINSKEIFRIGKELAKLCVTYRLFSPVGPTSIPTVAVARKIEFEPSEQRIPLPSKSASLPVMSSLWIGQLSPLEQICMESFVKNGHPFHLYSYDPHLQVPTGVKLKDAREILPEDRIFQNQRGHGKGSYAAFADLFRYKLLRDHGGYWVDTDVFCIRPFSFEEPYVFGAEDKPVANGIIKVPQRCKIMQSVYAQACEIDPSRIVWNELGELLAQKVIASGMLKYVKSSSVFSPIPFHEMSDLVQSGRSFRLPRDTHAVHLYQEICRRDRLNKSDITSPGSLLRTLQNLSSTRSHQLQVA